MWLLNKHGMIVADAAILTFIVGGKPMNDTAARQEQLHAIARAYVTDGLGKKNFDAIPYPTLSRCRSRKNYIPSLDCLINSTQ